MDLHYIDQNGNHFVVPDAPEGYTRDDVTLIDPPPTPEHRWVDGGWRIPEPPPEPVPDEVEGWQAEVAMKLTLVDPEDPESQNVWDRTWELIDSLPDGPEKVTATVVLQRGKVRRDSPTLALLAPMVPLSEERVDDLLRLAGSIQA